MQLPRVIGLSGLKQSGKNTLADGLATLGYETLAYADPLREMCLVLNPMIPLDPREPAVRLSEVIEQYGWDLAKERFPEVRRTMQILGTEVVRHVKPDYWIEQMRQRLGDGDGLYVVADVRFENEADLIREVGGIVVEVVRPGRTQAPDAHVSEAGVVADWVISNAGSKEDLLREFLGEINDLTTQEVRVIP